MKDRHIIDILGGAPLSQLAEGELASVREHAGVCAECARAYEAARVSQALLRGHAAQTFEPSPFFQTRVLAALRERRAAEEVPALQRLWRSAGALVSSMAAAVVLLAAFTFVGPGLGLVPEAEEEVAAASEATLLAPSFEADAELDDDQVFAAVYATVAEVGDGNE